MVHELDPAKVFDVNGQKYRVGKDRYGYIQIQPGVFRDDPDAEGETFFPFDSDDLDGHTVAFDAETARAVAEYIGELAE